MWPLLQHPNIVPSKNKTTGHIRERPRPLHGLAIVLTAALLAAAPVAAIEVELTTAEDPIFGNDRADDLYTGALGLSLQSAVGSLELGERMFTDRVAGTRFDETFLSLGRELPELDGWQTTVRLGAQHVGRGLLGEGLQNDIHRAIGSDPVNLAYPDRGRWYVAASAVAERPLTTAHARLTLLRVELRTVPGFQSSLRVGLQADAAVGPVGLRAGFGVVANDVESKLLGDNIESAGLTGELGLTWKRLELRYGYNDYGTASGHLTLAVRLGGAAARPGLER